MGRHFSKVRGHGHSGPPQTKKSGAQPSPPHPVPTPMQLTELSSHYPRRHAVSQRSFDFSYICTFPMTTRSAQRSSSVFRLIKTYLWSTVGKIAWLCCPYTNQQTMTQWLRKSEYTGTFNTRVRRVHESDWPTGVTILDLHITETCLSCYSSTPKRKGTETQTHGHPWWLWAHQN